MSSLTGIRATVRTKSLTRSLRIITQSHLCLRSISRFGRQITNSHPQRPVLPSDLSDSAAIIQPYYEQEQAAALLDVEEEISRSTPSQWKPRRQDDFNLPYFTDLSRVDPFLDTAVHGIPKSGRWPSQPVPQMEGTQFKQGEEDGENKLRDLSRLTGLPISYLEGLKVRELVSHRVSNQTRLGKIAKQYVLTVAGDGNGMVGIGEASSTTGELSSRISQYQAIKNLRPIIRYEDRTIYGNVKIKMGAVELELMSRPPGISDLAARVTRSRNPMNVIKATVQALTMQKTPDFIARGRGKKIVDVRRAYYGKGVY
ncbi:hypothetical protein AA313_de0204788 [Arthrobotrys entomopaga]|nr:hypothetical protein AA313_de0204788 [Arthrobotrys entomopaga]